jgi:hypothetical protein
MCGSVMPAMAYSGNIVVSTNVGDWVPSCLAIYMVCASPNVETSAKMHRERRVEGRAGPQGLGDEEL